MEKSFKVGTRVEVTGKNVVGTIAYIGTTEFSAGKWAGVILDEDKGKNNGTVQGKTYFECEENHGIFVRLSQLSVPSGYNSGSSSPATNPSTPVPTTSEKRSSAKSKQKETTKIKLPLPGSNVKLKEERSLRSLETKRSSFVETGFIETLNPQYIPGSVSPQVQVEERMSSFQMMQEIESLKIENKDLSEKLETLKIKRTSDKEQLMDFEKMKIQLDQLLEFKSRILESHAALQKDLQKAKQETKEAIDAKNQHAEEMQDLVDSMELATLDKEMAEEKAETIQLELEQLKEKNEELAMDLEILKSEMEKVPGDGACTSFQAKQLQIQNDRLKETLIKLRDLSAHEKHENAKLLKEIEHNKQEINDLHNIRDKLNAQITECEKTIGHLQEQVDAALGAEGMVEQLTEKSLALEEKVKEMTELVADLESLNEMNEELQENARETEMDLRDELHSAQFETQEALKAQKVLQEIVEDYKQTNNKFRDLVSKLQEQNVQLRESLAKETNKPVSTPLEVLDFKIKFEETKAHTKAIDLELRKLDAQQALQHVNYLCLYMPDNFMSRGGDHDAVLIMLLIPRLVYKIEIIATQAREKFPCPEVMDKNTVLKTHVVERYSFGSSLGHILYLMKVLLHQCEHILHRCSVDLYLKIGTLQPDLMIQEKGLDFFIDLLKKDQLDENICEEPLEKSYQQLLSIYNSHLANEQIDCGLFMDDISKSMTIGCDCIVTEVSRLKVMMQANQEDSEIGLLLKELSVDFEDVKTHLKKLRRRMPKDGSNGTLSFDRTTGRMLHDCSHHMNLILKTVRNLGKLASQHLATICDIEMGLSPSKLMELAHHCCDLVYGKDDMGPTLSLRNSSEVVKSQLFPVLTQVIEGKFDVDQSETTPKTKSPVILRAQIVKDEIRDAENIKLKLESRDMDVLEMKKLMKLKQDELSEMNVRKEMTEKRLSNVMKDSEIQIEKLQRKLEDTQTLMKRKEKEFEETLDHLQADIDSLESERGEMKEKMKSLSKKALFDGLAKSSAMIQPGPSPTSSDGYGIVKDSPMLLQNIHDLKLALKNSHLKNLQLEVNEMKNKLQSLPPLQVCSHVGIKFPNGDEHEKCDEPEKQKDEEELNVVSRRCAMLLKQARQLSLHPKVVDLGKFKSKVEPCVISSKPSYHLLSQHNALNSLYNQKDMLEANILKLMVSLSQAHSGETLNTFPTPQWTKAHVEKDAELIGRISFPNSKSNKVPVMVDASRLLEIHSSLLI